MFESILVPVDGSDPSNRAVALALQVAGLCSAKMLFLNVVNSDAVILETGGAPFVDPKPEIDDLIADGRSALAAATAEASAKNVAATTEQVQGEPVRRIVEFAETHGCDLIVMGSHGRSGLARLLLGSVTEGVLRHTHVPVLCIREEQPDAGTSEPDASAAALHG